ncbi:MAG: aminotransferase class III-fold pyridoxal phosphate-dependent enzyme [Hyphomicrobiales bacterium]
MSKAVAAALECGVTLGGPNLVEAKLARLMCERFGAVERIRFCNSGTESNILALSAARAFTGRSDILVVDRSCHGGVLTYTGEPPLNVPYPTHRMEFNQVDAAASQVRALGDRLAAVLIEPMIGAGGGIPADIEFLQALRAVSEENGAMLIFDEVMTSRPWRSVGECPRFGECREGSLAL